MHQMLAHDFSHILWLDEPIPDRIRIHDHRRSVLALVQAAGLVGAHATFEACFFDFVLEGAVQLAFAVRGTRRPGAPRFAMVGADKDVPLKPGQKILLP